MAFDVEDLLYEYPKVRENFLMLSFEERMPYYEEAFTLLPQLWRHSLHREKDSVDLLCCDYPDLAYLYDLSIKQNKYLAIFRSCDRLHAKLTEYPASIRTECVPPVSLVSQFLAKRDRALRKHSPFFYVWEREEQYSEVMFLCDASSVQLSIKPSHPVFKDEEEKLLREFSCFLSSYLEQLNPYRLEIITGNITIPIKVR